jgi:hypothetical protein
MKPIRIFISSPGDVNRERELTEKIIRRQFPQRRLKKLLSLHLCCDWYFSTSPNSGCRPEARVQKLRVG